MQGSFKKANGLVIAAVGFDGSTDAVVQNALSMARQFRMAVRLVHVVPPVPFDLAGVEAPLYAPYPPVNIEVEAREVAECQNRLDLLLKRYGNQPEVSGAVLVGQISASIIAEAERKNADVIITGFSPRDFRITATGLSTALALMHDSPLPVLAVCDGAELDFEAEGCRLLVLDDLLDGTEEAVSKGYEMAAVLKKPRVRHVHVHGGMRDAMSRGSYQVWAKVQAVLGGQAGKSEKPVIEAATFGDVFEGGLMAALNERGRDARLRAEAAGAQVELDLRHGAVREEIAKATADHNADLLIFGRHRMLHTRPFLIGHMPFRAMLEGMRGIMIVPSRAS